MWWYLLISPFYKPLVGLTIKYYCLLHYNSWLQCSNLQTVIEITNANLRIFREVHLPRSYTRTTITFIVIMQATHPYEIHFDAALFTHRWQSACSLRWQHPATCLKLVVIIITRPQKSAPTLVSYTLSVHPWITLTGPCYNRHAQLRNLKPFYTPSTFTKRLGSRSSSSRCVGAVPTSYKSINYTAATCA